MGYRDNYLMWQHFFELLTNLYHFAKKIATTLIGNFYIRVFALLLFACHLFVKPIPFMVSMDNFLEGFQMHWIKYTLFAFWSFTELMNGINIFKLKRIIEFRSKLVIKRLRFYMMGLIALCLLIQFVSWILDDKTNSEVISPEIVMDTEPKVDTLDENLYPIYKQYSGYIVLAIIFLPPVLIFMSEYMRWVFSIWNLAISKEKEIY